LLEPVGSFVSRSFSGAARNLKDIFEKMIELPRNIKQACLLSLDMVFVTAAMWSAVALRYGHLRFQLGPVEYACAAVTVVVSAMVFLRLGLYRAVIRFMGQQAIWAIITAVSYSSLVLGATIFFTQAHVPRSMPFIYWGLAMLGIGGTRLVVRAYYQAKLRSLSENVIIYGAGESGRQLLTALYHGDKYHAVAFVDDDARVQRSVINGLQVARPEDLDQLIAQHDITQVLLAKGVPVIVPTREENGFRMTPDEFRAALSFNTKAVILNNPSNPTGAAYTRDDLEEICEIAAEEGIFIIADEIYEKLVYDGFRFTSIASLGPRVKQRTILINGVSKVL